MTAAAPPRPPVAPPASEPEALIREARARQRRRRVRIALLIAAVVAVGGGVYGLMIGGDSTQRTATRAPGGVIAARRCPPGNLGTVAFLRGGALELLDLRGCKTRVLVRSHAAGPIAFSHGGRYVAFKGGFVSTEGGAVSRMSGAGTWSPRSDLLAVGTSRGGLELVSPGGRTRRLLPERWGVMTMAFAPDGRTLAVSRSRYRYGTSSRSWHQEIWLLNIRTGARRMIFQLGPRELAPAWLQGFSRDGRWLLFWEDLQNSASLAADGLPLVALPVTGGNPVRITRGELHYTDFLTWCGNMLVYVLNHGGRQVTLGDGVVAASPPGWRPQTILPAGGRTSWTSVACPTAKAGAGGGLVVAGGPTNADTPFGHEHRSLWRLSPTSGAKPERLAQADPPTGESDELPMWSKDGRWILFVRTKFTPSTPNSAHGKGVLYALDPFGGKLVGPIADIGATGNYYGAYAWPSQIDWHR